VDNSLGAFTRNIDFNGGNPAIGPGDKLVFTGGTFTTVTHTFNTASAGNIATSASTVSYTGLEPVDMRGATIADLEFNLPAGVSDAYLEDSGSSGDGFSQLR